MSNVNHPKHYQYVDRNGHQIEAIDIIEEFLTPEQFKGFLLGNAIKYVLRAGIKSQDTEAEDKAKAAWYLVEYNEFREAEACPEPLEVKSIQEDINQAYGGLYNVRNE